MLLYGQGPAPTYTPTPIKVAADGTIAMDLAIDETSLATSAAQTTGNSSLAAIDSKLAGPWSSYRSTAREKTAVAKGTAGTFKSAIVNVLSSLVGTLYVQLHDAATATAVSSATLIFPLGPVIAGDVKAFDLESVTCVAGVKLALSTTEDTYTAPATDDGWWLVRKA